MANARLKSLTLKGFRSFAEKSTITFPNSGMILFKGHNLDTGGSSGSGKSSLLLAISYLLDFCRFPATALQSWLTEEPMEVSGEFEVDDGRGGLRELIVTRGSKLTLHFNGEKLAGSAKQLEEKLTQLVGLPPELLAALTYRGQKQPGLFLSKTDSEKKEFLTVLLDLGKFETAVETSQAKAKTLETELKGQQYLVDQLKREVESFQSIAPAALADEATLRRDLELAQANATRLRNQVLDLRLKVRAAEAEIEAEAVRIRQRNQAEIDAAEAKLFELKSKQPDESSISHETLINLTTDLDAAEAFLMASVGEDESRQRIQRKQADGVYAQLMLLEKQLGEKKVLQARIDQANKDIASMDAELEKLRASVCPTCDRTWDDAEQKRLDLEGLRFATITQRENNALTYRKLDDLKPQIDALQAEYKKLGQFTPNPEIAELRGIVAKLQQDIAVEKKNIDGQVALLRSKINEEIASARSTLDRVKMDITQQVEYYRSTAREKTYQDQDELEVLERDQQMAESQVKGIQAALSRAQIDNAREQEREAQAKKRQAETVAKLEAAQKVLDAKQAALNAELDFQRLIGREGFLGAIFDEVLWEISTETNRLLGQFPNTSHVTLHFRSETSTQKGTIKKAITPVITVGGHEAPLASGLSGGMETAVELAVDLAVATVVSRRTGAMPGWLILDESFTGLGPVEAEASMEILRAFAEDKLVLVVDHASEFKSLFTEFVNVKYEGGKSRVE